MTTTNTAGNPHLTRAYAVTSPEENKALYEDWAATYNADVLDASQEYVAPALAVQAVVSAGGNTAGTILDAGCGTGFVGIALSQAGAKTIDGLDLSPSMLKIARELGVYRALDTADLSKKIEKESHAYDVVTCVGTLTHGHVGPDPALKEFVRVAKKGGVVVATVLDDIWVSGGYKKEVERLAEREVEVVGTEKVDYRKGANVSCRMVVMKKR
ncbi:S-adenosyl-L-methionine-dependent methyltransferase [Pseudovirgaria hyperparasitica]|uniref:S-adenosyl-L-methionine-dependent methyltransferase n=1 Tax=Pseudovirgaria hyperparasitica TaxID=470096 RepID=A0A6A6W434_9PEZI|nr:S-adenosyl-L-methionine-dependent methyltransferase [Pseudovirgaria hyperparasitica]KAF2757315.1 S-adenosyl-L-methionine-dependent methyltransferase [Pseudovirgaria hyperparasitica]